MIEGGGFGKTQGTVTLTSVQPPLSLFITDWDNTKITAQTAGHNSGTIEVTTDNGQKDTCSY